MVEAETTRVPPVERKEKPDKLDAIVVFTHAGVVEKYSRIGRAQFEPSFRAKMRAAAAQKIAGEQMEAGHDCPLIIIVGGKFSKILKGEKKKERKERKEKKEKKERKKEFSESGLIVTFLSVRYGRPEGWFRKVPEDKIIVLEEHLDQGGKPANITDTGTSMRAIAQYLKKQGRGQNMAIVSSATHLPRIDSIAEQLGLENFKTIAAEDALKSAGERRGDRKIHSLVDRFERSARLEGLYERLLVALSKHLGELYLKISQTTSKARAKKES